MISCFKNTMRHFDWRNSDSCQSMLVLATNTSTFFDFVLFLNGFLRNPIPQFSSLESVLILLHANSMLLRITRKEFLIAWSIYQLGISHVAMWHIIRTLRNWDPYGAENSQCGGVSDLREVTVFFEEKYGKNAHQKNLHVSVW